MNVPAVDEPVRRRIPIFIAVLTSDLLLRGVFALARRPFFDEKFTVWAALLPLPRLFAQLMRDSGPPLYYLIAHLLVPLSAVPVQTLRAFSIAVGMVPLFVILRGQWLGRWRFAAAVLLVVVPANFYYTTEARAYALCLSLVGVGVLAADRWLTDGGGRFLWLSMLAFLVAAWTHDYGVLFLPLPAIMAAVEARWREALRGAVAGVAAGILYIPGFWLAWSQPREAIAWMAAGAPASPSAVAASIATQLGFAAKYPSYVLFDAPVVLRVISILVVALMAAAGLASPRGRRFAAVVLFPSLVVVGFSLAGKPVYFPMRFESVLTVPFVLWMGEGVAQWKWPGRAVLFGTATAVGVLACASMILSQASAPPDPYEAAALYVRENVPARVPIVTSGLVYLEVVMLENRTWDPLVIPFPASQAHHPGWRAVEPARDLRKESEALRSLGSFVWVGEIQSPEFAVLAREFRIKPIQRAGPLGVVFAMKPGEGGS
ncbi:MAG: hypothetical protein WBX15_19555 [Thermoanaerobaculia bacterium]